MKIKKTKLALMLTATLLLSLPMGQVYARDGHCEIEETQLGESMKHIKSELRAYVKSFKNNDTDNMQKHLNELLVLSEKANHYTPVKIVQMNHNDMKQMDMSKMDHSQMDMSKMDHSQMDMSKMDHSQMDMSKMDHSQMDMSKMDHSQMDISKMNPSQMDMSKMDHSQMDMSKMDHSQMEHGNMEMDSPNYDMLTMPSMQGMSNDQHHQHMLYMQGMTQLQNQFKALNKTTDKAQIKAILGKIKEHSKKSHQQFRQDC